MIARMTVKTFSDEAMIKFSDGNGDLHVVGEWEKIHHRFGMAGEGQATIIEQYLKGRVLYVGCGAVTDSGDQKIENLAGLAHELVVIDIMSESIGKAKAKYGDVKGGIKVDHWGGAKGYQQRER